jgi:nitroreductase
MEAEHVLSTTRSVRKRLDLDRDLPDEPVMDCLRIAQQAPTASNSQGWHFVLVRDPAKRGRLASIFRQAQADHLAEMPAFAPPSDPQTARVYESAAHLADVMHRVPLLVLPCIEGRPEELAHTYAAALYGSIYPAVWSFMLALRARGIGSSWTSIHLRREREAAELLGIPDGVTQVALLPVAYFTGDDFRPAARPPVETITHVDGW